jgi:hypothetical protein
MSKYRLVEIVTPEKTRNEKAEFNFVPEIYFETTYEVQVKHSIFASWETIFKTYNLETAKVLFELEKMKPQIKKLL